MSTPLRLFAPAVVLAIVLAGCSSASESRADRLSTLPELQLLPPGAWWSTEVTRSEGSPVGPASVGRRFVTTMVWADVESYYREQLAGWSGPALGRAAEPDQRVAWWTRDGRELLLEETGVIATDLDTPLGGDVNAYALQIREVKK